jgi:hypothetical protein
MKVTQQAEFTDVGFQHQRAAEIAVAQFLQQCLNQFDALAVQGDLIISVLQGPVESPGGGQPAVVQQ